MMKMHKRQIEKTSGEPGWLGWASDFGSGHDLAVHGFGPQVGLGPQVRLDAVGVKPISNRLCPFPLCPSPTRVFTLSQK